MTEPSDAERYPTLSQVGQRMLERLREHPHAPVYRNQSGNRLTEADLERVVTFEREVAAASIAEQREEAMPWLRAHLEHCYRHVPYYRDMGGPPLRLADVPTVSRADLGADIARFVPDTVPLERMMQFSTSGTTGHPLLIPSHPIVAASYLAFHRRALARFGVTLRAGGGDVGLVLLGFQQKCFTYVSVTPTLGEAGLAKINLHPSDWRDPDDRRKYLEDLAPEVLSGDPLSFVELLALRPALRPRAILSTAMALLPGLRAELEATFDCPVVDLYSMNEGGPLGAYDPALDGHVLLQHCTLVEIVDSAGRALPMGQRGEITLTGGFNFCLPLLRYRTGDFASLELRAGEPVLLGLEGRAPVRFRAASGDWLNNIEVTHALAPLGLRQFHLHQAADGSLRLQLLDADRYEAPARAALVRLFGADSLITIEELGAVYGKLMQYTTELTQP